jgi:hypothetical protein
MNVDEMDDIELEDAATKFAISLSQPADRTVKPGVDGYYNAEETRMYEQEIVAAQVQKGVVDRGWCNRAHVTPCV